MELLTDLLYGINDFLWGIPMLFLLLFTHMYFTISLGFIQKKTFLGIRLSFTKSEGENGTISPYATLATSLAATIGTGNIIGISTAIALGGPGAVFWCLITGVLGIATSYAESFLSVKYRICSQDGSYLGGPMYVLKNVLKRPFPARLFALFTILASFGVGSSVQSNAIACSVREYIPLSPHLIGIAVALLSGFVMLGGVKQIAKVCTFLVPFMSLFYLLGCFYLLYCNRAYLTDSVAYIISCAFSSRAVFGGFGGYAVSNALRIGISRGLFTNEAGMGSLSMTAAAAKTDSPVRQSLISMTGVFWDTIVVCSVTGLVIVSTMLKFPSLFESALPGRFCFLAFGQIPFLGSQMLSVSIVLFAFATIIGWCYYGDCGARFLFKENGLRNYQIFYLVFVYLGSVLSMDFVFEFSDLLNALMVLPNVFSMFLLRKVIKRDTAAYFK